MMKNSKIQFDPAFIEEAVFIYMNSQDECKAQVKSFHNQREEIYKKNIALSEQEELFHLLYEVFFVKIGLRENFEKILMEFPLFNDHRILIFIKRVWSKREEDSDLYMQGNLKTVYIGLQTIRVLDHKFLESFLRHELLRISDMLDPKFCYTSKPFLTGKSELENNFIKDRFRRLWDTYINERLDGKPNKKEWTQAELLNLASDERHNKTLNGGGMRCPLCDFISYDLVKNLTAEAKTIACAVKNDYPDWEPSKGICPQCFEIYQSRVELRRRPYEINT